MDDGDGYKCLRCGRGAVTDFVVDPYVVLIDSTEDNIDRKRKTGWHVECWESLSQSESVVEEDRLTSFPVELGRGPAPWRVRTALEGAYRRCFVASVGRYIFD